MEQENLIIKVEQKFLTEILIRNQFFDTHLILDKNFNF